RTHNPFGYCRPVVSVWTEAAVPVAVKLTGLLTAPATSATTVFVPGVEPSVQLPSAATPSEPVVTTTVVAAGPEGMVMRPSPAVTRNVTGTLAIEAGASAAIGGTCSTSARCPGLISCTDGAAPTAVPTAAVWGSAE